MTEHSQDGEPATTLNERIETQWFKHVPCNRKMLVYAIKTIENYIDYQCPKCYTRVQVFYK